MTDVNAATAQLDAAVLPDLETLVDQRYGGDLPGELAAMSDTATTVLSVMANHRTIRRFTNQAVTDDVVRTLVTAAQSASTSSNRQAWSVIAVRDPERIAALVEHGRASAFVEAAPLVLVFVADWARASAVAADRGGETAAVDYLESTLVGFVDCGIAAQNALLAAEAMGMGGCYLGSLRNEPEAVADLLNLPQGSVCVVGLAIGYPNPTKTSAIKPRLPQDVVAFSETYGTTDIARLQQYDETLNTYYAAAGRPASNWSDELAARVSSPAGLDGRDSMRADLRERGLASE